MQTYCKQVKVVEIDGKIYRTAIAAAKRCAFMVSIALIERDYIAVRHVSSEAWQRAFDTVEVKRKRLEAKAARRILPIMTKLLA